MAGAILPRPVRSSKAHSALLNTHAVPAIDTRAPTDSAPDKAVDEALLWKTRNNLPRLLRRSMLRRMESDALISCAEALIPALADRANEAEDLRQTPQVHHR